VSVLIVGLVIAEAYSDRYKNALHSGAFARAVKQYRNRSGHDNIVAKEKPNPVPAVMPVGATHEDIATALAESKQQAQQSLEDLPHQIRKHIRTFHQHFQFFAGPNAKANVENLSEVPENLHKLMDDISGTERLAERIKKEILQDENARHVSSFFFFASTYHS
jgi:predicted metal-dependent hydrolase